MRYPLGQCIRQVPGHLSGSDLERAQNTCPIESVPLWSTREPEPEWLRPGKCMQRRAHFGSARQSTLEPEQCRPRKHTPLWTGANPVWSYTASTPHTDQRYLFPVFLPPHNTTEQVNLNKWPPLPPCVRVEIRHGSDLQTEETKINKEEGTTLKVPGAAD